jgi:hypothetical protein
MRPERQEATGVKSLLALFEQRASTSSNTRTDRESLLPTARGEFIKASLQTLDMKEKSSPVTNNRTDRDAFIGRGEFIRASLETLDMKEKSSPITSNARNVPPLVPLSERLRSLNLSDDISPSSKASLSAILVRYYSITLRKRK